MLAADTILNGRYRIVRILDSGGMGDVYEALQLDLGRPVAIKVLNAEVANEPVIVQRFRREAEALAALGHPNIVNIIAFHTDAGSPPILVMEKLEGASLRNVLKAEGHLAPPRAVSVALQILSALAAAHRTGIVHRDIKPGNVFLVRTLAVPDFVKVIDFGIAKVDAAQLTRAPLTMMGEVLGTLLYMAPEQAIGKPIDLRADLFSVGAILFEALSGERARMFDSSRGHAALFLPVRPLAEVMPRVDRRLAAVVDRALAFEPGDRFPSAEAMVLALTPLAALPLPPARGTLAVSAPVTQGAPVAIAAETSLAPTQQATAQGASAVRLSTRPLAPEPTVAFIPPAPATRVGPLGPRRSGAAAWLPWAVLLATVVVAGVLGGIALLSTSQESRLPGASPAKTTTTAPTPARTAPPSAPRRGPDATFSSIGVPQCDLFLRHYYHYGDNLPANGQDQLHSAARQLHDLWLKMGPPASVCEDRDRAICTANPAACQ